MHVSTTYCQSDKFEVEEKIYPSEVDWKRSIKIAENVDEQVLEALTAKYVMIHSEKFFSFFSSFR